MISEAFRSRTKVRLENKENFKFKVHAYFLVRSLLVERTSLCRISSMALGTDEEDEALRPKKQAQSLPRTSCEDPRIVSLQYLICFPFLESLNLT